MPPRWLFITVFVIYSTSWIKLTLAADRLNTLPVASNGWRPIIGTQVKPYITIDPNQQKQTISLTSNDQEKNKNEKNKLSSNTKGANGNQVHINHHGSTGHHLLPVSTIKQGSKIKSQNANAGKPAPRHPVMGKLHAHLAHAKRHKPVTKSTLPPLREEIMAPAPSSAIGSYAYFNQGPISIQSSQLGSNKPFHSPGHVDFSNHFAFSNVNNDVVLPQQQFNYQKHPNQNELHPNYVYYNQNDDFTRNLVPPPPIYKPQGEKETVLVEKPQKNVEQNTAAHNSQLVLGKHKEEIGRFPENLILSQYNQYQQNNNQGFDLEITKEKFKEYHTTLAPSSFKTSTESFLDGTKYTKNRDIFTNPSFSGYEVTEEKEWAEQFPSFKAAYPTIKPKYPVSQESRYQFTQQQDYIKQPSGNQYSQQDENINTHFLPTPYKAENAFPTSPTQSEISTIYSEISQLNKKKSTYKVPTSTVYNIKEVATHFPIFSDKRPETQTISTELQPEYVTEVTTKKEEIETESTIPYTKPTPQTTYPTRGSSRRPSHRRRRPSRPTTTTTETVYTEENIYQPQNYETERPSVKPHRRRRPVKYRTTESPRETSTYVEPTTRTAMTYRTRPTRPQPITEEIFVSQKHRHRPTYQTYNLDEDHIEEAKDIVDQDVIEETTSTTENIRNNYQPEENIQSNYQYEEESNIETEPPLRLNKRKRIRPHTTTTTITTTTEALPSTNLNIPENELDYTTIPNNDEQSDESATIREVYDFDTEVITTSTTPATTTTTTTEATTTKSNRIRRPVKYDVQRPRFSVKDYRQRFNEYMSSSTSTTETPKFSSESSRPKIRYPTRIRISTPGIEIEESTEPIRQKFIPKERRKYIFSTESTTDNNPTEKYQRTMNTRYKQYGRYRSSTEQPSTSTAATTQKVSIKPNIFNNLKRPQQLSLRNRIYNKRNITTTTTTEINTEEPKLNEPVTEYTDITIPFEIAESKIEVTTQLYNDFKIVEVPITTTTTQQPTVNTRIKTTTPEEQEVVTPDEAEAFLQLQRISDLTSSAHKQYNTPGLFKSVSPTSRRVPSYFTIATEDPILPIEAFFPNLNQKFNDRQ